MSHQRSEAQAVRPEEKEVLGTEGEEGDHEGEDEEQQGDRKTMKVLDPVEPTEQKVAEHFLTHLPFHNWCRHCARGRGVEMPHKKGTGERTSPEVHFDFCFMEDEPKGKDGTKAEETMPVLVEREVKSKMTLSTAVPSLCCEAGGGILARDRATSWPRATRSRRSPRSCRTGGSVRRAAEAGTLSSLAWLAAAAAMEWWRAIRSVEQQVRVMKDALEHRTGMQLTPRHPLMTWITEYAGHLRNRFEVGHDGKDGVREVQGEAGEDAWHRVRGGDLVEAEGRGRSSCEDDVLVGRWRLLGSEGGFRRDHRGRQERRVEDEVRAEEAVEPAASSSSSPASRGGERGDGLGEGREE